MTRQRNLIDIYEVTQMEAESYDLLPRVVSDSSLLATQPNSGGLPSDDSSLGSQPPDNSCKAPSFLLGLP